MSLTRDGVWKGGVWAPSVWTDGVWYEPSANDYGGFVRRSRIERERRQLHESNVKAALKIMMDFLTGTGR